MMPLLAGQRAFWGAIGAGAAILALIAIFWVFPAHMMLRKAQDEWKMQLVELRALGVAASDIPSVEAIQKRQAFRSLLEEQADVAKRFFADRAAILEAPLTGEGQPDPTVFKEAYLNTKKTQINWLESNKSRMNFQNIPQAFPAYPWTMGGALPDPATYGEVLHDYWSRYYMHKMLLKAGVSMVKKLEVRQLTPANELFDGIPFSMDVTLPVENVNGFVEQLISVSRSEVSKPVIEILSMSMQPEILDGRSMLAVQIDGRFLLLKRAFRPGETGQ
jgi:hypothetical protein